MFNDSFYGIRQHLIDYALLDVLGTFVGMVTDSWSFISMVGYEYFRKMLFNTIGRWIKEMQFPNDIAAIGRIVKVICYTNAIKHFGFARNFNN